MEPEDKFEELTSNFIAALEAVDVPFTEFVEGLRHARDTLTERLQAAAQEAATKEREEEEANGG